MDSLFPIKVSVVYQGHILRLGLSNFSFYHYFQKDEHRKILKVCLAIFQH